MVRNFYLYLESYVTFTSDGEGGGIAASGMEAVLSSDTDDDVVDWWGSVGDEACLLSNRSLNLLIAF